MQWLAFAFELLTTAGLALGLDKVLSNVRSRWLRIVAIAVGLSVAFAAAVGLVFLGAFVVGLVSALGR